MLIEILLVGLIYPLFLVYNYKNEKVQLSQLYVSFLLIPTPLAKLLKPFSSRVEQILEYEKNLWSNSLQSKQTHDHQIIQRQ